MGNLVRAQIAQAHLHVLSKTDLNPNFDLNHLTPQLSSQDPDLVETVLRWQHADNITVKDLLLSPQPSFRAHMWYQEDTITRKSLETFLDELDESVQRVKGWVGTFEGLYQETQIKMRIMGNQYNS